MTDGTRAILHVDMDAFFASVEQLDDPALRGKPVLVGFDGPRGVVAAASYESRVFGCHSAQPIAVAKRCCPDAIIVHPRGARYREISTQVFTVLHEVTPLVEPLSVDEAFLDVSGSRRLCGDAVTIARRLKRRIVEETGLTASVGVAWNKFVAKLASDWEKPDGLVVVTPDDVPTRLAALPIKKMWGVGPATERQLARIGVTTFGHLQNLSPDETHRLLGEHGEHFRRLACGEDDRDVTPDGRAKSVSTEQTFGTDVGSPTHVRQVLLAQTEHVATRLRHSELTTRTVTVKIRYGAFETITRSHTFDRPTDRTDLLWGAASALFDRWVESSFRPVRLIGVGGGGLVATQELQLDLFPDAEGDRHRRLDQATDAIQDRFGRASIGRGIPYTASRPDDADP